MTVRRTFFILFLLVSTLCLVAGYAIVGQWIGSVMAMLAGFTWLLARKYPFSGLPFLCLFAFIVLAVTGLLTGAPALLMICGSGISLGVWDLLFLDTELGSHSTEGQTKRYESAHLLSLTLALGSGLFVAFLGRFLNLQVPFVVLVLFVALALFGLDRVWGYLKKRKMHISR
jgi:hypothetical protein